MFHNKRYENLMGSTDPNDDKPVLQRVGAHACKPETGGAYARPSEGQKSERVAVRNQLAEDHIAGNDDQRRKA